MRVTGGQDLHEASLVPDLASRVDDVLVSTEGILTQRTHHSRIHDDRLPSILASLDLT